MDAPSVQSLTSLVEVQPGSVVSRMLLKNKAGSVTLFAFGAGEGLSEHTTSFEALLMVVDGRASVRIDRDVFELGPGEMIRLPAAVPHAVEPLTDMRMLLTMLRAEL